MIRGDVRVRVAQVRATEGGSLAGGAIEGGELSLMDTRGVILEEGATRDDKEPQVLELTAQPPLSCRVSTRSYPIYMIRSVVSLCYALQNILPIHILLLHT